MILTSLIVVVSMLTATPQVQDMAKTCHQSHMVISGALERQCDQKINQLEDYEVMSYDGIFWAEKK